MWLVNLFDTAGCQTGFVGTRRYLYRLQQTAPSFNLSFSLFPFAQVTLSIGLADAISQSPPCVIDLSPSPSPSPSPVPPDSPSLLPSPSPSPTDTPLPNHFIAKPPPSPQSKGADSTRTKHSKSSSPTGLIVGLVIGAVVLVAIVGFVIVRKYSGNRSRKGFRRLSRSRLGGPESFADTDHFSGEPSNFDYMRDDDPVFGRHYESGYGGL